MSQNVSTRNVEEEIVKTRNIEGKAKLILSSVAILMSIFHIYTSIFGVFDSIVQRSAHLTFALVLTFLIYPISNKNKQNKVSVLDWILILLVMGSLGYFVVNGSAIAERISYIQEISTWGLVAGVVAGVLLLEATRRTIGNALVIIILAVLLYAFFGQYLGDTFGHQGFTFMWIIDHLFFTTSSIYSVALGVSATFIFMFVLFGKFLELTGAGKFFIDIANSAMGKYRGGPAKTAVVASSLMGSISGSAVANTVSTGSITIPLMKKTGYKSSFAGAVEAVSSTGGQIMPPIMGAAAFVIASYIGVPFIEVAIGALIPAILYYLCLFFQIDFRSKKLDLRGVSKSELPNLKKVLRDGYLYFLPLIVIVFMLVQGYSPMRAGLLGIASVIVVSFLARYGKMNLKIIFKALDLGARAMIETAVACAAAGFIIGVVSLTGIGLKFSGIIINLAGENLLLVLIFTMITSMILGMGLPTVAAYIVQVSLTVPALVELGVPVMAAHLFIFYFAILANITPPVALASYAASGIANSNPIQTSVASIRLGIAGFIIPFMFVYGNELILIGNIFEIALAVTTAIFAIYIFAAVVEGWWLGKLNIFERFIMAAGSITMIFPGLLTDLLGLILIAVAFLTQKSTMKFKIDKNSRKIG
ncbi:TRAP transporter permease [Oceanobacillus salinisoli]|uniref:TRAP transporter permease n=1 Tax=Oceanobacillus salinisoli TaxID=2678611 RepID=UPI0012E21C38|nr:TRAP transporter permease [Oceanobacillus salinisoli]